MAHHEKSKHLPLGQVMGAGPHLSVCHRQGARSYGRRPRRMQPSPRGNMGSRTLTVRYMQEERFTSRVQSKADTKETVGIWTGFGPLPITSTITSQVTPLRCYNPASAPSSPWISTALSCRDFMCASSALWKRRRETTELRPAWVCLHKTKLWKGRFAKQSPATWGK